MSFFDRLINLFSDIAKLIEWFQGISPDTISLAALIISIFALIASFLGATAQWRVAKIEEMRHKIEEKKIAGRRVNVRVEKVLKAEIPIKGLTLWVVRLLVHNNGTSTVFLRNVGITLGFKPTSMESETFTAFARSLLESILPNIADMRTYIRYSLAPHSVHQRTSLLGRGPTLLDRSTADIIYQLGEYTHFVNEDTQEEVVFELQRDHRWLMPGEKANWVLFGIIPEQFKDILQSADVFLSRSEITIITDESSITEPISYSYVELLPLEYERMFFELHNSFVEPAFKMTCLGLEDDVSHS